MARELSPVHNPGGSINRRRFLKATGGTALVGGFAGCTGGDGGDGDGNDGGDGGGDGGDGTGGEDGGSGDLERVGFASPPVGLPVEFVMEYAEENGLTQSLFEEYGYELEYELTFEDATLFAAGQVDITTMGYFEAARLGVEQDQHFACFGDIEAVIQGVHVKAGGPYDPDETGGAQESIDRLVQEDGLLAIQSWAAGNTPFLQLVFRDLYGYDLQEEGGDFRLQTTDYGTMPQLLLRDEIDAAVFAGTSGGSQELADGDVKTLFWIAEGMQEMGIAPGPLVSLTSRDEYIQDNPGAGLAMIEMWNQGQSFIHENVDELAGDPERQEQLGTESEEAAQFLLDYIVKGEGAGGEPLMYEDPSLTEDRIEANRNLLSEMEDLGQIPSGWEDQITFYTPSDLEELL